MVPRWLLKWSAVHKNVYRGDVSDVVRLYYSDPSVAVVEVCSFNRWHTFLVVWLHGARQRTNSGQYTGLHFHSSVLWNKIFDSVGAVSHLISSLLLNSGFGQCVLLHSSVYVFCMRSCGLIVFSGMFSCIMLCSVEYFFSVQLVLVRIVRLATAPVPTNTCVSLMR